MAAKSHPKRLYQLSIYPGDSVPHFSVQKFLRQTAHIALMFQRHLTDVHKYALDGSSSLSVYFGVPERQRELLGTNYYYRESRGNWSSCCVPKFDLKAFSALSESEQDEQTTVLLEKTLLAVARLVGADMKPIREAAKVVRAGDYTARFPIPKLECKNRSGDQTARVWSCISRECIHWEVSIEDCEGELMRTERIPDECSRSEDFSEHTLLPRWDKKGFTLRNKQGRVRYALPSETPDTSE